MPFGVEISVYLNPVHDVRVHLGEHEASVEVEVHNAVLDGLQGTGATLHHTCKAWGS